VARGGEKVDYSPAARQRLVDNYGLLLEAPAEGVSVYWFTRGAGGGRETHIFDGSAMEPKNKAMLEQRMLSTFQRGAEAGEIAHYVRADGAGGYTISDSDDLDAAYAAALAYSEIMTVTINPVLKVEDAVGPIFAYLG